MWKRYLCGIVLSIITCSTLHAGSSVVTTTESFSNGTLPVGWTIVNNAPNASGWRFDNPSNRANTTGGSGGFAIADSDYFGFDTPMDTELRSPVFAYASGGPVHIAFKTDYRPGYIDVCDVDITIDGTTWTNIWRKTGTAFTSSNENIDVTSIAAGQSNVRFRFHYYNANFDWFWAIDDVAVSGIPATAPDMPIIGTATKAVGQATIAFTPPVNNGGVPITNYTVTSTPNYNTASGTGSPITVTGLNPNIYYTFTVTATNAIGTSSPSQPTNSIIPSFPPDAPTIGTVTSGYRQSSVSFTPPASNGGSAITSYTATSNPGNITATGSSSPLIVTGLTDASTYSFTVTTTNAAGTSPPSTASNSTTVAIMPVKVNGSYYASLQGGHDSVLANNTIVQIATGTIIGPLVTNQTFITNVIGGYDSSFATTNGYSTLDGLITLNKGKTIFHYIKIK